MYEMKENKKKKNPTKQYLGVAVALLAIVAGIFVGIKYWPEDKGPAGAVTEASLDDDPNYKAGEEFMKKIAETEGVEALGGGLYYKVIVKGNGPQPGQDQKVRVRYEGRLIDGTVFDSSYARKEDATFPVSGVITGWQIALKAMPVGSTWEVYIPQYYGYGAQGSGTKIPPYSALVFKVELLGIE